MAYRQFLCTINNLRRFGGHLRNPVLQAGRVHVEAPGEVLRADRFNAYLYFNTPVVYRADVARYSRDARRQGQRYGKNQVRRLPVEILNRTRNSVIKQAKLQPYIERVARFPSQIGIAQTGLENTRLRRVVPAQAVLPSSDH